MKAKQVQIVIVLGIALAGLTTSKPAAGAVKGQTITGAGATFPYPAYSRWAYEYQKQTGVKLNYQAIGSGGGIAQIKAGTVDFGASDAPLKPEALKKAGLVQFPMIMGGVVPVVNLPGVKANQLHLSPKTLAGIFLGQITFWNDPAIQKDNPDLKLVDQKITVVHRADGSGTTWIFTDYLSKVSPEWKKKIGTAKAVQWPVGIGGKGNAGVAAYVQRVGGAIGYVGYAFAMQTRMTTTRLKNQAGKYVAPTAKTFSAAALGTDWEDAPGFYVVLTNQPGEKSWPITGASFILMRQKQADPNQAKQVLQFFNWAYEHGDKAALQLNYVPIPDKVVQLVKQAWSKKITGPDDQPVWEND